MSEDTPLSQWRHRVGRRGICAAVAVGLAYAALLFATTDMGFTRDESYYFHAADEYIGWFNELETNLSEGRAAASFTQASVDAHWGYNPEHPVLMKTLFALSHEVFHTRWGWMSASDAYRLPAIALSGLLLGLLFLFTLEVSGRWLAASSAAVMMVLMPRFFFHAHLTCFDVPIASMWFVVIYAYWKSLDSTRWAWACGVLWGLALITKLNAFFIPIVLLAHWALARPRDFKLEGRRLRVPAVPMALFTMAVLGPLIHHLAWPRHWYDTFDRIRWYFQFHLKHEHYFVNFFGMNLWEPPFPISFPFVMTLVTTPVVILAWFFVGASILIWSRWSRSGTGGDRYGTGWLIALNILVPFLIIARPSTPVFGCVKHWFSALPFMMMVAGIGLSRVVDVASHGTDRTMRRMLGVAVLVTASIPASLATIQSHPYGPAYYNEIIRGYTGGADTRNMRNFWGYSTISVLDYLNEHAAESSSVFFHKATPRAIAQYQRQDMLREDIRYSWSIETADWIVYHHQKAFAHVESDTWNAHGNFSPTLTVTIAGVPLISLYERPERRTSIYLSEQPRDDANAP